MSKLKVDFEFFTSLIMIGISIYAILIYGFEYHLLVFIFLSIQIIIKSVRFANQELHDG